VKLKTVKRINGIGLLENKKGAAKKTKLWDLAIDGENSFVVKGILVHNSFVEYGTEPHFPPIEPLVRWAHLKLGLGDKEAKKAAWGIAKTIAKEGTEPRSFFRDALDRARTKYGGLGYET
jgi:hypothetical protein